MVQKDLLNAGLLQTFKFVINAVSAMRNKARYGYKWLVIIRQNAWHTLVVFTVIFSSVNQI